MIYFVLLGAAILVLAVVLRHIVGALENAGFDRSDAFAILLLPPVLEMFVHPMHVATFNQMDVYADPAGFFLPLLISARLISSGKVPLYRVLAGVALLSYVCNRHAVPGHFGVGITDMATPVIVASLYSLYMSPRQPAPLAYVSGTLGMIVGADIANLPELSRMFAGGVVTLGGAGMFDAIYLVGISAVFLDLFISLAEEIRGVKRKL
ncbi:DUF1614 domain-containing protein [Archaeoglobus veneficus]|uniref:DUF1614 domain-containing protein n=1 Tax=Archaeoglobus veneficus (strain DSM 11195 / SNP6) TaxID=693661 RepID=F2KQ95_ARCVS|nr:DUF1614 domain-containing protein [Archaeoglobus veneficus]AEA46528.1 protein of unknown function DUF1614 [Archaeoglobus veneficus SNP6]